MYWTRATASEPAARRRQRVLALAAALLALLLVGAATFSRPWHALEFKTFDVLTALSAPQRTDLPVVILAIDEPTFQELQQPWPFPRSLHAALLQRLHEEGAAAVGLDIVFADPSSEAEDAALARAIAQAGPVVLASTREKIDSANASLWMEVQPLQRFLDAGGDAGDAGVEPDDDFVVRRAPVARESFALRLAQREVARQPAERDRDAPDLSEALSYLRRSALGLAPHGVATKLILPDDQILYLDLEAPGPAVSPSSGSVPVPEPSSVAVAAAPGAASSPSPPRANARAITAMSAAAAARIHVSGFLYQGVPAPGCAPAFGE